MLIRSLKKIYPLVATTVNRVLYQAFEFSAENIFWVTSNISVIISKSLKKLQGTVELKGWWSEKTQILICFLTSAIFINYHACTMWTFFAESVMSSDIEADLSVPIIKRWDDSGLFLGFFFGYNQLPFASTNYHVNINVANCHVNIIFYLSVF